MDTLNDLLKTCEDLDKLPNPSLDLTTEIQVLDSLRDTAYVFRSIKPEWVSPVCLILLRELGRIPEQDRKPWRHAILSMTPVTDESIIRAILESESFETVARCIIDNPQRDQEAILTQLETLFRCIPYHSMENVVTAITHFQGIHKMMIRRAIPVIRPRLINCIRPLCEKATPENVHGYLKSLDMISGPQSVPLIKQLLGRVDPNNTTSLKVALKAVGNLQDRAYVPFFRTYLEHTDHVIRKLAATVVANLGGSLSVDLLKKQVQNQALSPAERKHALSCLAAIKDPSADKVMKRFARPRPFGLAHPGLRRYAKDMRKQLCSKSGSKAP